MWLEGLVRAMLAVAAHPEHVGRTRLQGRVGGRRVASSARGVFPSVVDRRREFERGELIEFVGRTESWSGTAWSPAWDELGVRAGRAGSDCGTDRIEPAPRTQASGTPIWPCESTPIGYGNGLAPTELWHGAERPTCPAAAGDTLVSGPHRSAERPAHEPGQAALGAPVGCLLLKCSAVSNMIPA
jgi:hypothetical protein